MNKNQSVFALDLGTKMGWAVLNKNGLFSSVQDLTKLKATGSRFLKLNAHLRELERLLGTPQVVYYEEVRSIRHHRSARAAHLYGGYLAVVETFCRLRDIPSEGIAVGTIKKCTTGKGNATKVMMMDAVDKFDWINRCVIDDNHADALALLNCALQRDFGGTLTEFLKEVRNGTRDNV